MRTLAAALLALLVGFLLGVNYAAHPLFPTEAQRRERARQQLDMFTNEFEDIMAAPAPARKPTKNPYSRTQHGVERSVER